MKINKKIISIPPYISTSWKNISALHLKGGESLVVTLHNGAVIELPNLDPETQAEIFSAHASFLEESAPKRAPKPEKKPPSMSMSFGFPLQMEGLEGLGSMMQHDLSQKDAPDLPAEILEKISQITQSIGIDENALENLPKAEPHCNCNYCQMARAMHKNVDADLPELEKDEETVTDDDLKFRDWDINQESDKIYIVRNPLDNSEHYQVYLGSPVGCTCGQKNCEHIRAVLST